MWFRRKKEGAEGKVCPLCETINPEESDTCKQCYYLLNKSSREQELPMDSGTEDLLLDELLDDSLFDPEEDSTTLVDVLTVDTMAVEIDQYEVVSDSDSKEVEDFTFIKSSGPTFSEIEADGDGPIEASGPTLDSLPSVSSNEEESETPLEEDFEFIEADKIEYDADEEDINLLELEDQVYSPPVPVARAEVDAAGVSPPVIELPNETVPSTGESDFTPPSIDLDEAPSSPAEIVELDIIDDAPIPSIAPQSAPSSDSFSPPPVVEANNPSIAQSPIVQNGSVWPWPSDGEWEYRKMYSAIMEAMEASKRGALPSAAEALDRVGPHLGERIDLIYYVGQVLRSLGREAELQAMLNSAKEKYPEDQNISTAAYHLA